MKLRKGTKLLLYLAACSLNGRSAVLGEMTLRDNHDLLLLSQRHTIGSIISVSLEKTNYNKNTIPEEIQEKWKSVRGAALKRRVLFDTERNRLMKILEQNNIRYCPLKGIILQDLYPMYEMREMSDNDILFDEKKRDVLKKIMLNEGYTLEDHGVTNHDLYTKPPVYNFEFHTRLFMHTFSTRFTDYYNNIQEKLIKNENDSCGYHLSDEDFYIYMTAHAYKHYKEGGTGIRSLTDSFIYNKSKGEKIDRKYINTECKKLGIHLFEKHLRKISYDLFNDPAKTYLNISNLKDKEKKLLSYISFTGSYCTKEDFIKSRIKKSGSKTNYMLRRLIPDINYYKEAHPFLYENRIYIPFFLLFRAGKVLLNNRKNLKRELRILYDNKKKIFLKINF